MRTKLIGAFVLLVGAMFAGAILLGSAAVADEDEKEHELEEHEKYYVQGASRRAQRSLGDCDGRKDL